MIAALALPVGAALFLFRALPHGGPHSPDNGGMIVVGHLNDFSKRAEPQFSPVPTPTGRASLHDLRLKPLEVVSSLGVFGLRALYQDGAITIQEKSSRKTVWAGPLKSASLSLEMQLGVHTLKDSRGHVLWTDAARISPPDLLFHRTANNLGALTDKSGVCVWAGRLPPILPRPTTIRSDPDSPFVGDGIHVTRAGGVFRVTNDRGVLLWSGPLPARPTIIARAGGAYLYSGPRGVESGPEGVSFLDFEGATGTVTVADDHGRTLGHLPIPVVALRETTWRVDSRDPSTARMPPATPDGRLTASGTLLLTYQDASGRVLRRSKVYRGSDGREGCLG